MSGCLQLWKTWKLGDFLNSVLALKRQDMGDSADSRFVYIAQLYSFSSYVLNKNNTNINFIDVKASKTLLLLVLRHLGSTGTYY